jgi:hypothetical protein
MSRLSNYVNVVNALLWLGSNKKNGEIQYKSPIFFIDSKLTQQMIAVTYDRQYQEWIILTDSADELKWFNNVPWNVIIVGDDYLMPVCKDIEIPEQFKNKNNNIIPKFGLKMDCIKPIANALMNQNQVLTGTYDVEDGVVTVDYASINPNPIRILNRQSSSTNMMAAPTPS